MKYIINNTEETRTYQGREVLANQAFLIPINLYAEYAQDVELIQDIVNGIVSISANGTTPIGNISKQIDFIKSIDITPRDSDGSMIVRTKTTKTGWHFEPRSIDFITSKHKSLYNRKHNGALIDSGTDYGDAVLKFFDTNDNQLIKFEHETDEQFQQRLDTQCCKSIIDWHPQYEMDIIGATVSVLNPPTGNERAYVWIVVAPDVQEQYGGNVPFMAGGWNLRFFTLNQTTFLDGRGVKHFDVDNVYGTNKFRVICKHEIGAKIELQFVAEHFKQ